jgi:hypothetical protein
MSVTRDQFALQMDRLIDAFGEKAYGAQREHLIWEAIDGLAYAQVIAMVSDFIGRMHKAPLPKDFSDAAAVCGRDKKRYALGEYQPLEQALCRDCADSGFIRLLRKDAFEKWAKWDTCSICCHCDRGAKAKDAAMRMQRPTEIARFDDRWLTSYAVDRCITHAATPARVSVPGGA